MTVFARRNGVKLWACRPTTGSNAAAPKHCARVGFADASWAPWPNSNNSHTLEVDHEFPQVVCRPGNVDRRLPDVDRASTQVVGVFRLIDDRERNVGCALDEVVRDSAQVVRASTGFVRRSANVVRASRGFVRDCVNVVRSLREIVRRWRHVEHGSSRVHRSADELGRRVTQLVHSWPQRGRWSAGACVALGELHAKWGRSARSWGAAASTPRTAGPRRETEGGGVDATQTHRRVAETAEAVRATATL